MATYRAVVYYRFKKGMEEKGIEFLEKELIKKAETYGCHHIELLQNEHDSSAMIGLALWNSLADARRFQTAWHEKEKELLHFCTGAPEREFYKIRSHYMERTRKAA